MNNNLNERPISRAWFFSEWVSIIGTFLICFVFLFHQYQRQCERSDHLYQMFYDLQKQTSDELMALRKDQSESRKESDQKFYDMLKERK